MPFIELTVKKGLPGERLAACMKRLTYAAVDTLENVALPMVRVTVVEVEEDYIRDGGQRPAAHFPVSIHFQLGPGREKPSIMTCMDRMVDAVSETLRVPKRDIRLYIHLIEGDQLAIGGKLKNFGQQKGT